MASNIGEITHLLKKNIVDGELKNSQLIQSKVDSIENDFKLQDYYDIIYTILHGLGLDSIENMNNIFLNKPKFKISNYKKILRIEAIKKFDELKIEKGTLFNSFAKNVCDDLKYSNVDQVLDKYSKDLYYIDKVSSSSELVHLLKEYKKAIDFNNLEEVLRVSTKIREFSRSFNIKYKEFFIKDYIANRVNKIKEDFIVKKKEKKKELLDVHVFIKLFINDQALSNTLKKKILDYFDIEIVNDDIKKIIHNIFNKKNYENYQIFGIDQSLNNVEEKIRKADEMKAYNRLNHSYVDKFNTCFQKFNKEFLIVLLNNIENLQNYKQYLSRYQYQLLSEMQSILIKAKCDYICENDKIVFIKENKISNYEYQDVKNSLLNYKKYLGIKRIIDESLNRFSKSRNEVLDLTDEENHYDLVFDDDNYKMRSEGSILNVKVLFDLIKQIDVNQIQLYDEQTINYIKKIIFDEGILLSVMKYGSDINIANIINSIENIQTYKNAKNIDLDYIIKQANLYSIVDNFTIAILGEKNATKIINNRQFLQNNSIKDMKRRTDKAVDLLIRSIGISKSAIPYDLTTSIENITVSRFSNDDPKLLVSGIDTNTCFRLDGNDNDFVFYTVLNKNGAVLKIENNHKFIGRMSIFRQANVLFINGVRTKDEKEKSITKDIIDDNLNIFKCLLKMCDKIIKQTTDSDLPIDYVVCNKAGILESSYFDINYYLVPGHIIKNALDTYNDDWDSFIHIYDDYKNNYFCQVNHDGKAFTTDFGSYAPMLIASRNNQLLERLYDIKYTSPEAIYDRPSKDQKYTSNFNEALEYVYRIDAIKWLEEVKDIELAKKTFKKEKYTDIYSIHIQDYGYHIIFKDGKEKYTDILTDSCKFNKLLVKK